MDLSFISVSPSAFQVLAAAATTGAAPLDAREEVVDTYREMLSDSWFVSHSIIISLLLLFLLAALFYRRKNRTLQIFSNANGQVRLSHIALADLVENVARQYGTVARPRAWFARRRGKLEIYVRLSLAAGQKLPQFSNGLQLRITNAVREAFGIENLGAVHIIVSSYTGEPAPGDESPVPYHGAAPAKSGKSGHTPTPDSDFYGTH